MSRRGETVSGGETVSDTVIQGPGADSILNRNPAYASPGEHNTNVLLIQIELQGTHIE
jgi:hypothetical protein